METIHRFSAPLLRTSLDQKNLKLVQTIYPTRKLISKSDLSNAVTFSTARKPHTSSTVRRVGWLLGLGENKKMKPADTVKAGGRGYRRLFMIWLSVDGYRAAEERALDVEVTGLDCDGQPIKVDAKGWKARILQRECDHLDGTICVDKMVPKTPRIAENLHLPLAEGCPKLGVHWLVL